MAKQPERAYQPLVRTLPDTSFYCFPETTETTPCLSGKLHSEEGRLRQTKRRREDPEEGQNSSSKRIRLSTGPQPRQVEEEEEEDEEDSSEARAASRVSGSSSGSQESSGSCSGTSTSGGEESSNHSSTRISSSCKTSLSTYSTADFEALYEELKRLGEGGYGSVFAGYRKEDRLPVAIKHIPMDKVTMTQVTIGGQLTDLPLEVSLMLRAAEDQPDSGGPGAVVLLLDWFQLGQELILVLERPVASVDLLTFMWEEEEGKLQEQDAKMILHQVVEGILELSSRGVLHRDIKPENILVETGSDTPRVRIIDLGCGCLFNNELYHRFSGTAPYTPPEWFVRGSYRAGPLTVWQVGVLLYEMLTGHCPFDTKAEIVLKELPCIESEISPNCQDFLKRCLTKRALGRPPLESLLHHPWLQ